VVRTVDDDNRVPVRYLDGDAVAVHAVWQDNVGKRLWYFTEVKDLG
jgi:hypothetical protein